MPRIRLLVVIAALGALLAVPFAHGATSNVVISQVYAGGGNAGATLHERLRRAAQPRVDRRRPHRLVGPVRVRLVDELAGDGAHGLDRPGPLLPRSARVDCCGRLAAAGCRRHGNDEPREHGRQGRARARHGGAHVRRDCGQLLERAARRGSRRLRLRNRLRRSRRGSRAEQHDRSGSCGRRLHGHERECDRLHRRRPGSAQLRVAVGVVYGRHDQSGCHRGRRSRCRCPAGALDRARAHDAELRQHRLRRTARADLRARHRVEQQPTGYALTVHRSAFAPADLPLGIATTTGGAIAAIPIAPAPDLLVASSTSPSAPAGDVWPTSIGFVSALPVVAPGHYIATLTFTVIGQ